MSYKQRTSQNGLLFTETSPLAVDGDKDTCTKVLAHNGEKAWWRVFLGDVYDISDVSIFYDPKAFGQFIKMFSIIF